MLQNSVPLCRKTGQPLGATGADFITGALYVAIVERTIQSTSSDNQHATITVESLALCYREHVTSSPIEFSHERKSNTDIQYWTLLPPKQPSNDTMYIYKALHNLDVLGYLRVAAYVNPRSLPALIQADDKKVPSMEPMSPEIYVFNALDRIRKQGLFQPNIVLWDLEHFIVEIKYFREEWRKEGFQAKWNCPRPFIDFPLVLFNKQEHYWTPRVVTPKDKKRGV